jgi:hypothetical protein
LAKPAWVVSAAEFCPSVFLEEQAAKTPQTSTLSAMINAILFFKGNTLLLVLCTVISPTL